MQNALLAAGVGVGDEVIVPSFTVSICGLPADLDPIMELAEEHDLVVIEDNAQSFLGEYKGRIAGSIGHFPSFSFQSSKT